MEQFGLTLIISGINGSLDDGSLGDGSLGDWSNGHIKHIQHI